MFKPTCLPILIGSLPISDHREAVEIILTHTPEIPLWPQLPKLPREGMVRQFLTGFPGLTEDEKKYWIDTDSDGFENQMTSFYQEYMEVEENVHALKHSRFGLDQTSSKGFFSFMEIITNREVTHVSLKGQVTGPVTTGTSMKDQHGKGIFYNDNLRDMLVKLLTLKARWQVEEFKPYTGDVPPIIFIDEPGMVSFGSSGFAGISREMVVSAVAEVIDGIRKSGGLAGVHICANGDWAPVLSSNTDIISFDAFFYFDNFILFKEQLVTFLSRGGILAWGIIPTGDPLILEKITASELFSKWEQQLQKMSSFGFSEKQLMEQTLIAPSCGTGSLALNLAEKVLSLTAEVSKLAQQKYQSQKSTIIGTTEKL